MKIAVLGCGYLGSRHARKLQARGDVERLVLHDRIAARARALAGELATETAASAATGTSLVSPSPRPPRIEVAGTPAEAIRQVDAVVVAASTAAHCDLTLEALGRERPVLVEKPIAATLAEADRMVAAARAAGKVLSVGHVERFNPVIRELTGRIEAPRFVEAHRLAAFQPRSLDIDVVLDLMIHDIDLVLHFTRELPSRIDAAGTSVLTGRVDIANARLAFPNRSVANLTASRVSLSRTRKIRFFMPRTYLSIDLAAGRAERYTLKDEGAAVATAVPSGVETDFTASFLERIGHESVTGSGDALEAEQEVFIRAARGEAEAAGVSGEEGRAALAVALRIVSCLNEQEV